ncbi:MAG: MAPEG family protein [Hyphomonadaceae bacterium]|nr:MAPEG family protein [Hyphomonadaceae bacterium]
MQDFAWTALVTLVALLVYFITSMGAGRARYIYKLPAPAITGNEMFERHYRVQMNTLEWLPIFLPALWLFAWVWGDQLAAAIGAFWPLGRIIYMVTYVKDPAKRSLGFATQGLAALALLIGALVGVVQTLLAG